MAAWEKLVEIAKEQAKNTGQLVELQRDVSGRLRGIERNTGLVIIALVGVIATLLAALVRGGPR